ncbi:MAG: 16S rRNA (cytosine(967)-C(5))-methyltransferase RsmB [Actinomycetota bacterium]|nr:16S rRNA (cytosine(967)-C(5))-methyltransferase RsmB [Actinomycetota bacterium]MDD5665767.1 16S rRNA (cytosine(967)-C(5))-methyltransferase RsmB [Actinomycetota bacterium]
MADAREVAYGVTRRVNSEAGYLGLILRYGKGWNDLDSRDRSLVTEMAYGLQRQRNKLDFIIAAFSTRPLNALDPEVLDLLRLGVYQLSEMRIPRHAAVNETVGLAKRLLGKGAASYVNAVMRAASDGLEELEWPPREELRVYLATLYSHPLWLVDYLLRIMEPEEAEKLCGANNVPPSLTLRANTARTDAAGLLTEIESRGGRGDVSPCLPEALTMVALPYASLLNLLERGRCVVQDMSSMLVSHALNPGPRDVVIDACAAPGGKATHLAQLGGRDCRVIAVDSNESRLRALRTAAGRIGLANIEAVSGDSTRLETVVEEDADGVLVDAPCSGLGTLRRNPELRWRRQPGDLAALARLQEELLLGCAPRVRAGGALVYSVCTFTMEETTGVVQRFLAVRDDFRLEGQVQTWPHVHDMEGMFIARFVRS